MQSQRDVDDAVRGDLHEYLYDRFGATDEPVETQLPDFIEEAIEADAHEERGP